MLFSWRVFQHVFHFYLIFPNVALLPSKYMDYHQIEYTFITTHRGQGQLDSITFSRPRLQHGGVSKPKKTHPDLCISAVSDFYFSRKIEGKYYPHHSLHLLFKTSGIVSNIDRSKTVLECGNFRNSAFQKVDGQILKNLHFALFQIAVTLHILPHPIICICFAQRTVCFFFCYAKF